MAGSTTRFGFASGAGGDAEDEAPTATTLFGRDVHLDRAALSGLGVRAPVEAPIERVAAEPGLAPVVPAPDASASLAESEPALTPPERTGKSRFPALARLFGRWNTGGDLVANADRDSLFEIPRPSYLRPLGLLAVAASVSFLVVVLLIRFNHHPAPARIQTPAQIQPLAAPPPQLAPPVQPAAPPAPPVAAPAPTEERPVVKAAEPPRPAVRRPARRRAPSSDPDSLLPLNF